MFVDETMLQLAEQQKLERRKSRPLIKIPVNTRYDLKNGIMLPNNFHQQSARYLRYFSSFVLRELNCAQNGYSSLATEQNQNEEVSCSARSR